MPTGSASSTRAGSSRWGTCAKLMQTFGRQKLLLHVDRLPERLSEGLTALGVEADPQAACLVYRYRKDEGRLDDVLAAIRADGMHVNHIQDRHTNLEDVFLTILRRGGQ